jgi:hypothetical protein
MPHNFESVAFMEGDVSRIGRFQVRRIMGRISDRQAAGEELPAQS